MSKEKQIEEMAETLDEMCDLDLLADCEEKDCSKCMATALYNAGYHTQSEWISVEERLPENFESVLVLATSRRENDGYDVLIAYHDRGEWEERCVHGDGNTVYAHVKYWMPLPEPPKGE